MLAPVNEVAILVSAILALAIGSIWYSPLLFGEHWIRATGLSRDELEATKSQMSRMLAFAAFANILTLFLVAQFIALGAKSIQTIGVLSLFLALLHGSLLANSVIWEQRPLSYLLINFGYSAVVIFAGAAVIGYWPW